MSTPEGDPLDSVQELIKIISASLPRLTSKGEEEMPREFAAAGLARNNRLLAASLALYRAALCDVCRLPARPMIENVLFSLYSLFGGRSAYERIRGDYVGGTGTLHDALGLGGGLAQAWTGSTKALSTEKLTGEVGKLLAARGEVESSKVFQRVMYDTQFRQTSEREIHGGVGSIGGYVDRTETIIRIREVRQDLDDGVAAILLIAALHCVLAHFVLKEFGCSTIKVDSLKAQLLVDHETIANELLGGVAP